MIEMTKTTRREAEAMGLTEPLDLRTTEELAEAEAETEARLAEIRRELGLAR